MFTTLFGFGGRLGRFAYFMTCMGFVLSGGIFFTLAFLANEETAKAGGGGMFGLSALETATAAIILWMCLSTQAARIRDLGLRPSTVLGGLMTFYLIAYGAMGMMPGSELAFFFSALTIMVQIVQALITLCMPSNFFQSPPLSAPQGDTAVTAGDYPRAVTES